MNSATPTRSHTNTRYYPDDLHAAIGEYARAINRFRGSDNPIVIRRGRRRGLPLLWEPALPNASLSHASSAVRAHDHENRARTGQQRAHNELQQPHFDLSELESLFEEVMDMFWNEVPLVPPRRRPATLGPVDEHIHGQGIITNRPPVRGTPISWRTAQSLRRLLPPSMTMSTQELAEVLEADVLEDMRVEDEAESDEESLDGPDGTPLRLTELSHEAVIALQSEGFHLSDQGKIEVYIGQRYADALQRALILRA